MQASRGQLDKRDEFVTLPGGQVIRKRVKKARPKRKRKPSTVRQARKARL